MASPTLEAIHEAGVDDPELLAGILSDADVLALMDEAERAPEVGAAAMGLDANGRPIRDPRAVIYGGEEGTIMATALRTSGYVRVYDNRTGAMSVVNRHNLPQVLKKRNDRGVRVFTTKKPAFEPAVGTSRCMLHPDRRTPEMDAMGLSECNKGNLINELQVRLHMQHRHKSSWEAIEEMKRIEREAEERAGRLALAQVAHQGTARSAALVAPVITRVVAAETTAQPAVVPHKAKGKPRGGRWSPERREAASIAAKARMAARG